jgi:hypothetical protein
MNLEPTRTRLNAIVDAVVQRGYDEKRVQVDDYAVLIATAEYRQLVIFQLYDSYFPPKRHEYELQLLTALVEKIASTPAALYAKDAIVTGLLGGVAYDIFKDLLSLIVEKLKPISRSRRHFQEIEQNATRLMKFFERRTQADTATICRALQAQPDQIEPLLMLLGFRRRRCGKRKVWLRPAPPPKR